MALASRVLRAIRKREQRPSQQFGQANDAYTANGATGCTHTVLQWLAWYIKGRWYTHDEISKMVGYPNQSKIAVSKQRGLYPSEVSSFLRRAGLPYVVRFGLTNQQVLQIANKLGPVGFGHHYGWVPEWQGYRYGGVVADGRPNGFAAPSGKAGKTQLTGWAGAHFGLLLGYNSTDPVTAKRVYYWEPNHNSGSRPEDPPYDRCTTPQWKALYNSYHDVLGRSLYAIVPTKAIF